MTHKDLVEVGYKWVLKSGGCGVAFKELNSGAFNGEYPDVIGFASGGHSLLIEVKTSRSDFLSDSRKRFRKDPKIGMGSYRYYLCPKGLIKREELPEGWGLIYVDDKLRARVEYKPMIEVVKECGTYKYHYTHEKCLKSEHGLMYSALRRLFIKGYVKHIYDKDYNRYLTNRDIIELNQDPSK